MDKAEERIREAEAGMTWLVDMTFEESDDVAVPMGQLPPPAMSEFRMCPLLGTVAHEEMIEKLGAPD